MNKEEKEDKELVGGMYYIMGMLALFSFWELGIFLASGKPPVAGVIMMFCALISGGTIMFRLLDGW